MKFKKRMTKLYPLLLAIGLIFSMVFSPVCTMTGYAEDAPQIEEADNNGNNPDTPEIAPEGEDEQSSDMIPPSEDMVPENQIPMVEIPSDAEADSQQPSDAAEPAAKEAGPQQTYPLELVYGNADLPDEDAFVLLIFGDGFTAGEQDKFFAESRTTAEYVMNTSPYDEFKDVFKIYAMGVISNESGARADNANNQEQANADTRDTYFGTSFWTGGMQRLLSVGSAGSAEVNRLKSKYLPAADFNVMIVNSETYGGSGGSICVASLNSESLEMMLHELGHTIANLADEYFAGASYAREYVNMTSNNNPETIKWKRFLGKNGVGIYEYDDGGDGWYRPHETCKMRYLGQKYAFCEVCKEAQRKVFSQYSNITKLFYQQYADTLYEDGEPKDVREYFIIRKGRSETTGDQLGDDFTLEYKDSSGTLLPGAPTLAGNYTVTASYAGDSVYGSASLTANFTIELPDLITLNVADKVYDGEPADLDFTVNYDKEYYTKTHYTGKIPYSTQITHDYDSDEAPIVPGDYEVTLTAYDKTDDKAISTKKASYSIKFKTSAIYNHDTDAYPGAMPYYNNKTLVFAGEGFTADQQDEFEALAKKYADYFRSTEPFKEADIHFNYHTVETVSNESGISTASSPKDTYFSMSLDDNGKLVPSTDPDNDSVGGAAYVGYYQITSYYQATVVIVNEDNVKENAAVKNSRVTVFAGTNESDMDFAAKELLNHFSGQPIGYRADSDEAFEAQRTEFLKSLYYTWYGTDYAPVLSRAYNETFVENGTAYDLAPYFKTYVLGMEADDVTYTMTYYENDNGVPGAKLDAAPSKAGNYFAFAELNMDEGRQSKKVTINGVNYSLPLARGLTPYTIQPVKDEETPGGDDKPGDDNKPGENPKPDNGSKPQKPDNTKKNPQTGDSNPVMLYNILGVGSLALIVVLLCRKRRIR